MGIKEELRRRNNVKILNGHINDYLSMPTYDEDDKLCFAECCHELIGELEDIIRFCEEPKK